MSSSEVKTVSASKRSDIVGAAKQLLWERGYEATSPRDVLVLSGAGQGSLYHHFRSKLDLARAALEEMAKEEIVEMDGIFSAEVAPLERVQRYLCRERHALRGCRLARLANEAAIELPEFRQPISDFLNAITTRLSDSLLQAQDEGALSADVNAKCLATTLVAVVEGGFILSRVHWDPDRMQTAIDGISQLLSRLTTGAYTFPVSPQSAKNIEA